MGNLTGLGDGSIERELGTGGRALGTGGVGASGVTATGGVGAPLSTGGEPGSLGSGGASFGSGGTGGASQASSGGSGAPASGGSGSGGAHSGGATIFPPASGGAPGSGGLGTGGAQTGGATVAHTGGATGSGGATGTGGAIVGPSDPARYNFESSSQGWGMAAGGDPFSSVGRSTAQHFSGSASLAATLSAASGKTYILEVTPPVPAIAAGATVTFHVYVPSVALLSAVQPYVLNDVFKFIGANTASGSLKRDGWTTIVLSVPATETNVTRLGVQFASSGAWTGTLYVDSIDW
jgi:hypothetical protein